MPGMRGPGSPTADSDAEMELSSPDPMSSVQSLGFALELPSECLRLQVGAHSWCNQSLRLKPRCMSCKGSRPELVCVVCLEAH